MVKDQKGNWIEVHTKASSTRAANGEVEIRSAGRPISSGSSMGGVAYLVLDHSGSMAVNSKLEQAQDGAKDFAKDALKRGYNTGLIAFSFSATHLCPPTRDLLGFFQAVDSLHPAGGTNLAKALQIALSRLGSLKCNRALIVVTDGEVDNPIATLEIANQLKRRGVDIIALGTDDADQEFLKKLASRRDLAAVVDASELQQSIASSSRHLALGRPNCDSEH